MTNPTPPADPDPLFSTPNPWAPPFASTSPAGPPPAPPSYPAPGPGLPPVTAMLPGFPAYDPYAAPGPVYHPYAPAGPHRAPAYPPSSPYAGQPARYPYDYGYGAPYGYAGFAPPARTEGLAIASLVVSCVSVAGLCAWGFACVLGILGAIFGHVARSRIRSSGARGSGMALAGIIIGWTSVTFGLLMAALFVTLAVTDGFGI